MQRKQNFSDRLSLDAYRLSLATGSMSAAVDYMEMAQLALQAALDPSHGLFDVVLRERAGARAKDQPHGEALLPRSRLLSVRLR